MKDTVDVLLEIGAEEIPDRFLPDALAELERRFAAWLAESSLTARAVRTFGTTRRLAVLVEGAQRRQADRTEEVLGPPVAACFKDGAPTAAAEGFARKVGVAVADLRRVPGDKGERLAGTRQVPGRSLEELVAEAGPRMIETLPWPKNMRWGDGTRSWVRPVHWIACLAGRDVVPLAAFGIAAGRQSRGHRTLAPGPVEIASASAYVDALRAARVVVDREERKAIIRGALASSARAAGGEIVPDAALIETTCDLVEWPVVLTGRFPERYLELPDVVLSTAMRVHQRFFALSGPDGRLLPAFLHVANQQDPQGTIAAGNARVLVARLEDASFFWSRDRATPMESHVPALAHVLFQDRLGTYLDKVRRMERLAIRAIPEAGLAQLGDAEDVAVLVKAVELCKADLCTEMVREFGELQGVMGGIYLRLEGYGDETCRAVEEHYLPASLTDPVPSTSQGALLSVLDKMDTLAGCFGVGLVPTGSKDPFGLRRAAQGLLRTLLQADLSIRVTTLLDAACENFRDLPEFDEARVHAELVPYLAARLRFLLTEGVPLADGGGFFAADEVAAAMAVAWEDLPDVLSRARAVAAIRKAGRKDDFDALSVAFKRVRNIVKGHPRGTVDRAALLEPAEKALAEKLGAVAGATLPLVDRREHLGALEVLATLRPEVDAFFNGVLVMAEDEKIRTNRLALLQEVEALFLTIADIGELVVPGGA